MSRELSIRRALAPLKRAQAAWLFDRGVTAQPAQRAKQRHLLALAHECRAQTLVETGTYLGETTAFFAPRMGRVVSVEIDPALHARAVGLFADRANVEILLGDALDLVPGVLSTVEGPSLLWLDGHFSGGVTGRGELDEPAVEILRRIRDVAPRAPLTIVVDDLRLFGADETSPSLGALVDVARETFPHARLTAEMDSLVVRVPG